LVRRNWKLYSESNRDMTFGVRMIFCHPKTFPQRIFKSFEPGRSLLLRGKCWVEKSFRKRNGIVGSPEVERSRPQCQTMTAGDCGDCHKDKRGPHCGCCGHEHWLVVCGNESGTSRRSSGSGPGNEPGWGNWTENTGVERKYWSYCQVSLFVQKQGSQLIAHAPLEFEKQCHPMGHDHPGNKNHFGTQYPQQFGVPTSNPMGWQYQHNSRFSL
jgi:hypothetical protein